MQLLCLPYKQSKFKSSLIIICIYSFNDLSVHQWLVRLPSSAQTDSETIHLSNHHYLNNIHHPLTIKRYNLPIKLDNQHLNVLHHDLFYILPNKFQGVQLSSSSSTILSIEIIFFVFQIGFVTIYIVSTTS